VSYDKWLLANGVGKSSKINLNYIIIDGNLFSVYYNEYQGKLKIMNNLKQIEMVPTLFNNNMPVAWDIKFLAIEDTIGSIKKCQDRFVVTTTFNDTFITDDCEDLEDLLVDLFCPNKSKIN